MDHDFTTIALTIGGTDRATLRQALTAAHIQCDHAATTLLQTMPVYPHEQPYPVRLGVMSIRELGFSQGATLPALIQAAQHYGLGLVPLTAAVCLRLQWRDQPAGQLLVASPALSNGGPRGFALVKVGAQLKLNGFYAPDDTPFDSGTTFAFELNV